MKRLLYLLFLCVSTTFAQCPTANITFSTQNQIDNFVTTYAGCTTIDYNVSIISENSSDITNLNGLSQITSIMGNLTIASNSDLENLAGLENLTNIGGILSISNNTGLSSISALSNLTSVSSISIASNPSLATLNGLNNVNSTLTTLNIFSNSGLTDISAFNHPLTISNNLTIQNNPSLSECAVTAVCNYIGNPTGTLTISGNVGNCENLGKVSGICVPSEINLKGNGVDIAHGSTTTSTTDNTDFGSTVAGSGSIIKTFTIENSGVGKLYMGNIYIGGASASEFSVSQQPTSIIDATNGTATFQVTFAPSTGGQKYATVIIPSNDADENPYTFAIKGTSNSTTCGSPGYDNRIQLRSQEDVDNFQFYFPGCTHILGGLEIKSNNTITNLLGLTGLTTVDGGVLIERNAIF